MGARGWEGGARQAHLGVSWVAPAECERGDPARGRVGGASAWTRGQRSRAGEVVLRLRRGVGRGRGEAEVAGRAVVAGWGWWGVARAGVEAGPVVGEERPGALQGAEGHGGSESRR